MAKAISIRLKGRWRRRNEQSKARSLCIRVFALSDFLMSSRYSPTHNWPVFGHDWAVNQLRKSLLNERVRHAYLIVGTDSIGKNTLAHAFSMALNCTHPDDSLRPCGECRSCRLIASGSHPDMLYSELDPSTGALKIETIRSVMRGIAMKPFEARYRIAIFQDFDHAQPRAQDALLKTLEEPPPNALLILLAPSTESLLSTITSRSQILALRLVAPHTIRDILLSYYGVDSERAELLARLSGGRLGWAIRALQDDSLLGQRDEAFRLLEDCLKLPRAGRFEMAEALGKDKLALAPLLELWQTYWRDLLLMCEGSHIPPANSDRMISLQQHAIYFSAEDTLNALKATRNLLEQLQYNINLRLALEVMFLDYPGLKRENL
jgi:DNA polymerase-3 subunit delta'